MPALDGYDATVRLREMGFRGLILGCTGSALAEDIDRFLGACADAVFIKPVDVTALKRVAAGRAGDGSSPV